MNRPSVLLVDDDEDFLLYGTTVLEQAGFHVFSASSFDQAIKQIRMRRFELVLTDLRLPGACGLDVLGEARLADALSVGIVVTGHGSVDTAMQALREGAYDYLVKPSEPDVLVASAKRGLEHYRLKQALIQKTQQLETLEAKLHARSELIQNVSHELKNPLSVVYGYSSFLLDKGEAAEPEDVRRSVRSIHNNAERLSHLLEELVDSVRLSSHKVEIEPKPACLKTLCEEQALNVRPQAEARGLTVECSAEALTVNADVKRIHQVLSNLLTNAMKFTPAGGRITIRAERDGPRARVTVADTGCGIASEDLPRLFERFFQAESTRKDHAGLGLGLEICRGLVELHGGSIWAESAPGEGSRFHFTLPLA